jgi:hypothetical protein
MHKGYALPFYLGRYPSRCTSGLPHVYLHLVLPDTQGRCTFPMHVRNTPCLPSFLPGRGPNGLPRGLPSFGPGGFSNVGLHLILPDAHVVSPKESLPMAREVSPEGTPMFAVRLYLP